MLIIARQPTPLRPLRYVPYGDSITDGAGASSDATRWSSVVADLVMKSTGRLLIEDNAGYPGDNVIDTLGPGVATLALNKNPELIIFAGGLNDMRKNSNQASFTTQYGNMVQAAINANVPYILCINLAHMTGYSDYGPTYNQGSDGLNHTFGGIIQTIAAAKSVAFADIHTGMAHNDSLVTVDGVHPNDAGHAAIAAVVAAAVISMISA